MTDNNTMMTDTPDIPANDLILAKEMADTLNRHYPNHLWAVTVDGAQGMADVRNLSLSGDHGFRLRIVTNYSISEFLKRVVRAGGEILERFRLSLGAARPDEIDGLQCDRLGRVVGDYSKC